MENELKELEENKLRIEKEIEGLGARIAEERECLEYEEWDAIEKRIAPIRKELAEMKKLQKFAEERLSGIKKNKLEEITSKKKENFKVVHFGNDEVLKIMKVLKYFLDQGIPGDSPQFVILTGGVASGKTTIRRKQFKDNYINFDFGEICDALEKEFGTDSPRLSEYAVLASDMILHDSIVGKKNIVIEIIGDNKEILETLINKMKGLGYKVSVSLVFCDPVAAYERHLKAVEEDKTYRSSYFTQDATISFFYRYFELGSIPQNNN